ncbi:mannitol-1-phosphate 5-dehydrogenase [Enterococcus olivae]
MKKVLHFGAGNIGRGLIGQLFSESGYEIVFVDTSEALVTLLNEKKEYVVSYWDNAPSSTIKNFSAILGSDEDKVFEEIKKAELITTAVTPNFLPAIGKVLAKGIAKRIEVGNETPLSIVACENMEYATSFLKKEIEKNIDTNSLSYLDKWVSFPNSAIDRLVPNQKSKDGLSLSVEKYYELTIEKHNFKYSVPEITGANFVDNLQPYIERKLFVVNNAHASVGYYAFNKGYKNFKEALDNEDNRFFLKGIIAEAVELLIKKYPDLETILTEYGNKTYIRFTEDFQNDSISRICRNPIRKLSKNERIAKPTRQYIETFLNVPQYFTTALASGLLYNNSEDDESVTLQKMYDTREVSDVITEVTGFEPYTAAHTKIYENYTKVHEGQEK